MAYLTVETFAAGRISGSGRDLATTFRHFGSAKRYVALLVPLNSRGRASGRPLHIRLRVGFLPAARNTPSSSAFVSVNFR